MTERKKVKARHSSRMKKMLLGTFAVLLAVGMLGLLSMNTAGTSYGSAGHAVMAQHTSQDGLTVYMNEDSSIRSVFGLNLWDNGDGDDLLILEFSLHTDAGTFDPTTDLDDVDLYYDDSAPNGEYNAGDDYISETSVVWAGADPDWTCTITTAADSDRAIPNTDSGVDEGVDFLVCFETDVAISDGVKFTCSVPTDGVTVTGPTTLTTNAFTARQVVIDTTAPVLGAAFTAESNMPNYFYNPGLDGVRNLGVNEEKVYYNNMPDMGLHQRVWVNWSWTESYPYAIDYDYGNDDAFNEDLPDTMYSNDAAMTYMLSWNENGMTEGPDLAGTPWGHRLVRTRITDLAGNSDDYYIDFFQDNDAPDIMTEGQFGGAVEKCNSSVEWFYPYDAGWDQDDCWLNGVYHVNESNYFLMSKADPLRTDGTSGATTWDEAADIYEAKYSVDGGGWVDFTGAAADADIGALAPGEHIIAYSLTDHVNNTYLRTDTVVVAKYIGDYTVSSNMLWAQNAYLCNGNVTIDPTFQMDLTGTLFMNNSGNGDHWIHNEGTMKVRDGGIVTNLIDPTVYGDDGPAVVTGTFDQGFLDASYGFQNADGSTLSLSNDALVERAVEVYSEGTVNVGGSTIQNNDGDGIRADCSVMVYGNSFIINNGADGIDVANADFSEVTVKDSNITGNGDNGIELDNASGSFQNCNIIDNTNCGIALQHAHGTGNVSVEGCDISSNGDVGFYTENSYYYPFYWVRDSGRVLYSGNPNDCSDAFWDSEGDWDETNFVEFELDLSGEEMDDDFYLSFWHWYWGQSGDYGRVAWYDETTLSWKWLGASEAGYTMFGDDEWIWSESRPMDTEYRIGDNQVNDAWILETVNIDDTKATGWENPVPFRFYYISSGNDVSSGWYIDDLYLTADGETTLLRNWEATGDPMDPRFSITDYSPNSHWEMHSIPDSYPSNNFLDTTFRDNGNAGIYAFHVHSLDVQGCEFWETGDGGSMLYGIQGGIVQDANLQDNLFDGNSEMDWGVHFETYTDATVVGNTFYDMDGEGPNYMANSAAYYMYWACDYDIRDNLVEKRQATDYAAEDGLVVDHAYNYNAHSGTKCLNTARNDGLTQTMTVTCNLAGMTDPILSWWELTGLYDSEAKVEMSTDSGANWHQAMWYNSNDEEWEGEFIWTQRFLDLKNWTGQSILVRFSYMEQEGAYTGWWIDDIKLSDYTATTAYSNDFEDMIDDDGWTVYGHSYDDGYLMSPWEHGAPDHDFCGYGPEMAHSGDYLWGTDLDMDTWEDYTSYLQSPVFDLSGAAAGDLILLSYWEWISIEGGYDSDYDDESYVLVSTDGLDWDPVRVWPEDAPGDQMEGWHPVTLDISEYAGQSEIRVRFLLKTAESSYDGWYIDDFMVRILTPGTAVFTEDFEGPLAGQIDHDFWWIRGSDPNPQNKITENEVYDVQRVAIRCVNIQDTLVSDNIVRDDHGDEDGQSITIQDNYIIWRKDPPATSWSHRLRNNWGGDMGDIEVANNDVRYSMNGVHARAYMGDVDVWIHDNDMRYSVAQALHLGNRDHTMTAVVENNQLSYSGRGIHAHGSYGPMDLTVTGNIAEYCTQTSWADHMTAGAMLQHRYGVAFFDLRDNVFSNNAGGGVYFSGYDADEEGLSTAFIYMEGNDISHNDEGVLNPSDWNRNTFFHETGMGVYFMGYMDEDYEPVWWITMKDNTITDNRHSNLYLWSMYAPVYAHLEGNDFSNARHATDLGNDHGHGIYMALYDYDSWYSNPNPETPPVLSNANEGPLEADIKIVDNIINGNYYDPVYINAYNKLDVLLQGNQMNDNVYGNNFELYGQYGLRAWMDGNTMTDNYDEGIMESDYNYEVSFTNNVVSRTGTSGGVDINPENEFSDADYIFIDMHDNVFTENEGDGFEAGGIDEYMIGRIYNNVFSDNGITSGNSGLDIDGTCDLWGVQIDNNRFEDNGDDGMQTDVFNEPLLAHSGTHAWHPTTQSYTYSYMDVTADLTTAVNSATFSFWHWLENDDDSDNGGFLTLNDGTGWERIDPKGEYDGDAWCYGLFLPDGNQGGAFYDDTESASSSEMDWEFEEFDLSPWIGQSVELRWWWGAEDTYDRGWYIDDIELTLDGTRSWLEDGEGENTAIRDAGPGQTWFDNNRFELVEFFPNAIFGNDFIGNLGDGLDVDGTDYYYADSEYYKMEIYDNYFYLNGQDEDDYGMRLDDVQADIYNNDIVANTEGVYIDGCDLYFFDNTVTQNSFDGVEVDSSGFDDYDYPVLIQDNVFTSNGIGLNIHSSSEVQMINNDFLNNYQWGLWIDDDTDYTEWRITGTSTVKNNAMYWWGGDGDGNMNPGNIVIEDGGTLIAKDNKLFGFGCDEPGEWALIVEAGGMLDAHDNNFRSWYNDDLNNQGWTGIGNIGPGSNPTYVLQGPILNADQTDYARFGDTSLFVQNPINGVIMTEVPWGTQMDTWGQYQVDYSANRITFFIGQNGNGAPGNVQGRWWWIDEDRDYYRFRIYGSATLDGNEIENARTVYVESGWSNTRQEGHETVIIRENEIYNTYFGGIYSVGSSPEIFLNNIHDTQYGIYYEGGTVDVTQGNWIHDITADGIHMEDTTGEIIGNTIDDNREGIVGYMCEGLLIQDNEFHGNLKDAIHMVDSNGTEILDNLVDTTADKGIYIDASTMTTMEGNEYTWNYYGLFVTNSDVEVTGDMFSDSIRDDIYADVGSMITLYDAQFDWTESLTVLETGQVDVYFTATVLVTTPMDLPIGGVDVTIDPASMDPVNGTTDADGMYSEQVLVAVFDGTQDDMADAFEVIAVTATSGDEEATFEGPLAETLTVILVLDFQPMPTESFINNYTTLEDRALEEILFLNDIIDDDGDPENLVFIVEGAEHLDVMVDEDNMVSIVPMDNWNGEENITITVSDGVEGHDVLLEITVAVMPVQDVPMAQDVFMTPEDPNNGDMLAAHFTLVDPDYMPGVYDQDGYGDMELNGTQIRWFRNGDMMKQYNDQVTVSMEETNPGEVWYFTIKPFDGQDFGDIVSSQEVTIINVKPDLDFDLSVDMIIITPEEPTAGDDLMVEVDTSLRAQYANFTFQWNLNGVPIEGATENMLMSEYLTKGNVITVTVTPSDGYNKGDPVTSRNVKISNGLPSIDRVIVSPLEAYKDSTLTATPVGFGDIDPDDYADYMVDMEKAHTTFKYQWYRQVTTTTGTGNDTTTVTEWVAIPGATGMTLDSDAFNKGDMVMVEVTPYDGEGYGEVVQSESIEILNTPPVLGTVKIIPAEPTSNSDLQAIPSGYFDLDGDDSKYYFRWYDLEGLLQQGWGADGGNVLDSSRVEEGAVVYVIVIPNDGDANGTAITSASVQVASDEDGDGIPDGVDHDSDNDGYGDEMEKSYGTDPYSDSSSPDDLDGDGVPDQEDVDIDGDGILNDRDAFPMDPAASKDLDGDGLPDAWNPGADADDSTTGLELDSDMDGDGIDNDIDAFPSNPTEWQDTDGDGIGDNTDPDADGDGVPDEVAEDELATAEKASEKSADAQDERTRILWYFFGLITVVLVIILIMILLYVMRKGGAEDMEEDEPYTSPMSEDVEEDEDLFGEDEEEELDEDELGDEDDLDEESEDEDMEDELGDEDGLDEDLEDDEYLDDEEEVMEEDDLDEELNEDEPEEDDEIDPDLDELPDDDLDEEKED